MPTPSRAPPALVCENVDLRGRTRHNGRPGVIAVIRPRDNGKKINGRKTFGIVDTLGLLVAVAVVAASISDNVGGIAVTDRARERSGRFAKLWCDAGFKLPLHRALSRPSRRRGGREEDPPAPLRGPPEAMDSRAHLVMADE